MRDVASMLKVLAIEYNDKIIVLLGNRPEAVMSIFGVSYAGGTFIPVPDAIRPDRLTKIIQDSGAKMIITDEKHFSVTDKIGSCESLRAVIDVDNISTAPARPLQIKPAYPAALMYTSGTTGNPKGVICPHEKIMSATHQINDYMLHRSDDVVATCLPLSHGYGLYQIFTVFEEQGTVLLEPNFTFPIQMLQAIQKYKATGFAAVPSMIPMIQQIPGWRLYLSSLEYLTTAGAALPPPTFEMLKRELPDVMIMPMYGQTECVRALYYPAVHYDLDSCGIPIPGTTTTIDPDTGELIIESPHVMDGYWNNEEATRQTFIEGRLYTGDIFKINDDGLHYYLGRMDDLVKIKGERCSPQELDNALAGCDGVIEAASFTMPDDLWGNRMYCYVASNALTKQEVMRYCKKNLEPHMMPAAVVIVDKIPKNENGKISRRLLMDAYLEYTRGAK